MPLERVFIGLRDRNVRPIRATPKKVWAESDDKKKNRSKVRHARTDLILNSAGEGIAGLDTEGMLTFVNPTAAQMLGSTPAELIGKELHRILSCGSHDGGSAHPDGGLLDCLRDGKEHRGAGEMFRSCDGGVFSAEYTSTPKFDNDRLAGAVVVFRDVTEARRGRERIEASLKEKEALLREIHHRVKNNLQVVCSLLKLNSRDLRDSEALHVFEETRHRVKAMALVYETPYRSGDLAGISFREYIPRLLDQLLHSYGLSLRQVAVSIDVDPLVLHIDMAIRCALMLTELISNSVRHASVAREGNALRIHFRSLQEPNWLLQVEDSENGGVSAASSARGSSFGLELVKLLTEQLNGEMRIEREHFYRGRRTAGGGGHQGFTGVQRLYRGGSCCRPRQGDRGHPQDFAGPGPDGHRPEGP